MERVLEDSIRLLREAEQVARQRDDPEVAATHIEEARWRLQGRPNRPPRWRNRLVYLGGALLGAGVQGFFDQIAGGQPDLALITIWVLLGFLGLGASILVGHDEG